ncbi:hypothetical protein G9A89_023659 [Geosiphon pyriformis]|nr:hypothetical protein G9A89_023659 [Geosiphon pyriformis]
MSSSRRNEKQRKNEDPKIRLSKILAYILRHGAEKEGLHVRPDGFVSLDELLNLPKLRGKSFADIKEAVQNNDKQRYKLVEEVSELGGSKWFIRANQGHSIQVEQLELVRITDPTLFPQVIHGTYMTNWKSIESKGLSKMSRNHIHFANGRWGDPNVKSGVRANCDLFIIVDLEKAIAGKVDFIFILNNNNRLYLIKKNIFVIDGIEFFESANGVILSKGIDGILSTKYFKKVEDISGNVILSNET